MSPILKNSFLTQRGYYGDEGGFALVSVMFVAGLATTVIMATSGVLSVQSDNYRRQNVSQEVDAIRVAFERALNDPFVCECMFNPGGVPAGLNISSNINSIPGCGAGAPPLFEEGSPLKDFRGRDLPVEVTERNPSRPNSGIQIKTVGAPIAVAPLNHPGDPSRTGALPAGLPPTEPAVVTPGTLHAVAHPGYNIQEAVFIAELGISDDVEGRQVVGGAIQPVVGRALLRVNAAGDILGLRGWRF